MKTFKVGDRVLFTADTSGFNGFKGCSNIGRQGEVIEIDLDDPELTYRVLADDGNDFWYNETGIALIDK